MCPQGALKTTLDEVAQPSRAPRRPILVSDLEVHRESQGALLHWGSTLFVFEGGGAQKAELERFQAMLRSDQKLDPTVRAFLTELAPGEGMVSPLVKAPEILGGDPRLAQLRKRYQVLETDLRLLVEKRVHEAILSKKLRATPDLIRKEWPEQLRRLQEKPEFTEKRVALFLAQIEYLDELDRKFVEAGVPNVGALADIEARLKNEGRQTVQQRAIRELVPVVEFGVPHSVGASREFLQKKFALHQADWAIPLSSVDEYKNVIAAVAASTDPQTLSFVSKNGITGLGKQQRVKYDMARNILLILDVDSGQVITCYRPHPKSAKFPRGYGKDHPTPLDFVLSLYTR